MGINISQEAVVSLEQNLHNLSQSEQNFADSLLNGQYGLRKRGYLTEKQAKCFTSLVEKSQSAPEPKPIHKVGALHGLIAMFDKAKQTLKYPKIWLEVHGYPIQLKVAGVNSKYHGEIMITDGEPYGVNQFYGTVDAEGAWSKPWRNYEDGRLETIEVLLNALSNDPEGTASAYGHLTGNCSFCKRKLEDERSTEVGYGPVCAKKWGLKWGKKK